MIDLTLEQFDDYLKYLYDQLQKYLADGCIVEEELDQYYIELARLKELVKKSIYIPKKLKERIYELERFDETHISDIKNSQKGLRRFLSWFIECKNADDPALAISHREFEYIEFFLINTSRFVHVELENGKGRQ